MGSAVMGQAVHKCIGRRIVGLACGAHQRGDRGKEHKKIELMIEGLSV